MPKLPPVTIRDFRQGMIRQSSVNSFLVPPNSVSHSMNVNFGKIIGSAVVRPGTTKLGATVASGKSPLGLTEFVTANAVTNLAVGVFTGASTATLYFYDTSWHTSNLTSLSNTSKVRFAQLGNYLFEANGSDAMKSTTGGTTWGTTNCLITYSTVGLLLSTKTRMLASGHPTYPSRVFFSSIVSTTAAGLGILTWNDNTSDGDWIDFNPGDGSNVTGFAETSDTVLVFKGKGMFRINAITATVDPQYIFNIGAVSQEAITECQGTVYFFSGQDIRQTTGAGPTQISRLGVQDFIDAIPQANWTSVASGNDGLNIYFSIGNITLNSKQNDQVYYSNVVLKFSPRDQNWSAHSYSVPYRFYTQFTQTATGRLMYGAEDNGTVQAINLGLTDNGTAIFYELKTQGQEFGDLSHTKTISDKIVVFSRFGGTGKIQVQADDNDPKDIPIDLNKYVAVGKDINFKGNEFIVRWYGESTGVAPVLDGFCFPNVDDEGISQ